MKITYYVAGRLGLAILLTLFAAVPATSAVTGPLSGFIDPSDGQFDASDFLINKRGFLLNPIVITEPAIGYGGGATLLFFHEGAEDAEKRKEGEPLGLPPSISFAVGGGTETSSWLSGGGHFGSYRGDSIRYTGAAGYGSFNIDFYLGDRDIGYGIDGLFVYQDLQFRVKDTNFFLGGRYVFTRLDSEFDFGVAVPASFPDQIVFYGSGFAPVVRYDSRDSIFTPSNGIEFEVAPLINREELGADRNYETISAKSRFYRQVHERVVLAGRLDAEVSFDGTPFFALLAISARGVPATRYQNEYAVSSEFQARWRVWKRWSLIGFFGMGWSGGDTDVLQKSEFVPSGGGGFRYLIARLLGVHMGMDFAGSEDEFVFYFQVGTGW